MKIGILTFHKAYNYGAFMQAFSLQIHLSKRFPEETIEIIDFVPLHEVYRYWIKVPIWVLLHQGGEAFIKLYKKYYSFSKTWHNYSLSKHSGYTTLALKRLSKTYDYIIVGSDAVFNDTDLGGISGISPFFLEKIKIPKSTYAASAHGLNYMSFSTSKKERIRKALDEFQLLSLRDKHTESFVYSMLGKQIDDRVFHSCDPTVFMKEIIEDEKIKTTILKLKEEKKKVVALMLKTERYGDVIRKLEKDSIIISLANSNRNADIQLIDISPFAWATCLKYVDYTVTDYFHGTLVSLRMGKPVISIDISENKNGNRTKIGDLLIDRLQLPEFYFPRSIFDNLENMAVIKEQCERNRNRDYTDKILGRIEAESKSFDVYCEMLERKLYI